MISLKIIHEEECFVILENVLKVNLRTDRSKECIFRISGGKDFKNITARHKPVASTWVQLFTGLPKKSQDTSLMYLKTPDLRIRH